MATITIAHLRTLVRKKQYVVSVHAAEELDDDNLNIFDLESIILTGKIVERQRDRKSGESKLVVAGETVGGIEADVVVKRGASGLLIVITVYTSV